MLLASATRAHDPVGTKVTWDGEIARIVNARCVRCHSPDGRGPMPLTSWKEARPWAKAIKEEVLTRRMPKWHAARGYGDFSNDPSLSPFEIALIVSWADGGAPERERRPERPFDAAQDRPEALEGPPVHNARSRPEALAVPRPAAPERASSSEMVRTIPCGTQPLSGRLLAIRPQLDKGASARISAQFPDGQREIIGWIRNFDPEFIETYWLRRPVNLPPRSRLNTVADGRCSVAVTLGGKTQN